MAPLSGPLRNDGEHHEPRQKPPTPAANGDTKGTSVIVNAIAVLRCFTADEPLLGVTEIANRVGLHKSTVSRILATFEQEHLVERDPETRRFRLGLGLIAVAGPLLAELEERRVAYPVLRELTEQTGETSALMVWNGTESMCVEQIPSPHQIKHTTPLGARYKDALSASVQVFLSAEPAERVRALLRSGDHHLSGAGRCQPGRLPIKLGDVARRAGPSTTANPPWMKSASPRPSTTTAATSWPPSSSRPRGSASPANGCKAWAKPAPPRRARSPPAWADARRGSRNKARKPGGRESQASRASRAAKCNAASRPVSRGSPPHSSKIRRSRWCIDCRST